MTEKLWWVSYWLLTNRAGVCTFVSATLIFLILFTRRSTRIVGIIGLLGTLFLALWWIVPMLYEAYLLGNSTGAR